jgi:hypothetical protein
MKRFSEIEENITKFLSDFNTRSLRKEGQKSSDNNCEYAGPDLLSSLNDDNVFIADYESDDSNSIENYCDDDKNKKDEIHMVHLNSDVNTASILSYYLRKIKG